MTNILNLLEGIIFNILLSYSNLLLYIINRSIKLHEYLGCCNAVKLCLVKECT